MENKFTILLVDDETDFLDPIAFWLESKGYTVKIASNGKEAVDSIQKEVPDIVAETATAFLEPALPRFHGARRCDLLHMVSPCIFRVRCAHE